MSDIATRSMRIAPRLLSAGIAMALLVSACALNTAPDRDTLIHEELPNMKMPAAWVEPSKAGAVADNWVAALGDQQLSALVVEAITYNSDLRIAAARVEAAEAGVKAAGAQMYPSVTLLGRTGGKVGGDGSGIGGVIIPASWEIDLWGRVRYGRRAAEDQYASAEADAAAAAQSVAALVAKSWFLAIEARQQRDLAAEMVASSRGSLRLAEDRKRIGPGSELEVNQADASLQTLLDVERSSIRRSRRHRARSSSCLAAIPQPRSRRRALSQHCRRRRPAESRRNCSSGDPTSSPRSAASMRHSTWPGKPRPRACRRFR